MNKKKHVTFCFGRLNPPHYGHSSLIQAVKADAHKHGGDWFIFTSKSHDKSPNPKNKNPIAYAEKVQWIDLINPGLGKHFIRDASIAKTFLEAAAYLYSLGYTSATFVAGDEDMPVMKPTLVQYNHQQTDAKGNPHRHGFYAFHPFLFHANPRVTSATSARAAAIANDPDAFFAATKVPKEWTVNGKTLLEATRAGLVAELPEPEEQEPAHHKPAKQLNTKKPEEVKMKQGPAKALAESMKKKQEAPKPRNFVAKNAIQSGAGAHKDKKKAQKQGDVKHKGKLEFAEGRLGASLNSIFEEKYEALYEADIHASGKKLPKDVNASIKGGVSIPGISQTKSNGNPYAGYRFALALAGAPEYPTEAAGAIAGDPLLSTYTDEEFEMIKFAAKQVGAGKINRLTNNRSEEVPGVNTQSVIAKPKRNKYGV